MQRKSRSKQVESLMVGWSRTWDGNSGADDDNGDGGDEDDGDFFGLSLAYE